MKAVILVGGQGTRLRPLTLTTPKPLLPLVNRPSLDHVLFLLRTHDITEIILTVGYRSESFEGAYGSGSHLGVSLTYVREQKPLDTGWAIKNVQRLLDPDDTFLVFNGDILTDLDLSDMLLFHRENGSVCTISLTPVEDPSAYGVVDMDDAGGIRRFIEKPKREEAPSKWINAGTYIMEPHILDYLPEPQLLDEIPPGRPYSVEFGLFPTLVQDGKPLYGYRSGAYWMDIGTPEKYLQAHVDLLAGRLKYSLQPQGELFSEGVWVGNDAHIDEGARLTGPVVLGDDCRVMRGASITGPAVLGDGCQVGEEAELARLVAWRNVSFTAGSVCTDCLIGNDVQIGEQSRIEGMTIVGDNASIGAGSQLKDGARVQPGDTVPASETAHG